MALLVAESVSKSYGERQIIDNLTIQIDKGQRIGLVGRNGEGKTTLLRMLCGNLYMDGGRIILQGGVVVKMLSQHIEFSSNKTIYNEILSAFEEVNTLVKEMKSLEEQMKNTSDEDQLSKLLEQYSEIQDKVHLRDGFTIESEAVNILQGVGFREKDFDKPVSILSGGEKNRLALAKILAERCDILFLDEPTNNLDIQSIEWLESYLKTVGIAYLVVSHDRYFLDNVSSIIWHLSNGKIKKYPGNFSKFVSIYEKDSMRMNDFYERQQHYIDKETEFIRRNMAGQKTNQAKSRLKKLQKLERIDRPQVLKSIKLNLKCEVSNKKNLIEIRNIKKSFPEKKLFEGITFELQKGEKIGIIGKNGTGKSTLLKIIMGEITPDLGYVSFSKAAETAYFDQKVSGLKDYNTIADEIFEAQPDIKLKEVYPYLAKFRFQGNEIYKKIESLSGGEKSRVYLAKLFFSQPNLMILDEPTNHLDFDTSYALENIVRKFEGAIIVVSHDRYFLKQTVNKILYLDEDGHKLFWGTYEEWVERQKELAAANQGNKTDSNKSQNQIEYETKKRNVRDLKNRENKIAKKLIELEHMIEKNEKVIEEKEELLAQPDVYSDGNKVKNLVHQIKELKETNDRHFHEWEELNMEMEEICRSKESLQV